MLKVKQLDIFGRGHRDPAPSRIAYLLQRMWLRKVFRRFLFLFSVVFISFWGFLFLYSKTSLLTNTKLGLISFIEKVTSSPALKVTKMDVITQDPKILSKIESVLTTDLPVSSLEVDVEAIRSKVESLAPVNTANVRVTSSGLLEIEVIERKPVVVHHVNGRFEVLDIEGISIDNIQNRADRSDLPLIVGLGANNEVSEALMLLIESSDIVDRVTCLSRIGTRRWDIVLDQGLVIKLPEYKPMTAIRRVISLQAVHRILDRDISYLDFRDLSRPMIGLTVNSAEKLKDLRAILRGESI